MIVAITGHVEEAYFEKAWFHEMDEVVPKPINIDILTQIFEDILEWANSL